MDGRKRGKGTSRAKGIGGGMGEIILHPSHPDYCKECTYYDDSNAACKNEKYKEHSYEVVCVWKYCKFKRK